MKKIHAAFFSVAVAALLTGCANQPASEKEDVQQSIDDQIMEAAKKIQAAQSELFQAGAIGQETSKPPVSIAEGDLITLSWQGDAVQLLEQLARDRGLLFATVGVRLPLPVNIDVKDSSYEDLMRLLSAQIGYRATIGQYNNQLMLRYNQPRL